MSIGCAPAPTGCGVTERLTTELGGRREVARRKSAGKDQTRSYSKPRKSCGGMPLRVTRAGRQQFGASPLPGDRTMARRSNRHRSESFGAVGVALGALDVHLEYLISRPCLRPLPAPRSICPDPAPLRTQADSAGCAQDWSERCIDRRSWPAADKAMGGELRAIHACLSSPP